MKKRTLNFHPVSQEHPMGCAVACVASLCQIQYQKAIELFKAQEHAWTRGFYCSEVVEALSTFGMEYRYDQYNPDRHTQEIKKTGTIVFVAPCAKYPAGHYLLRSEKGWMNPWSNYPLMNRVQSAFEKRLPGKVSYLVYAK